jgi:hypothetical protein
MVCSTLPAKLIIQKTVISIYPEFLCIAKSAGMMEWDFAENYRAIK